MKKESIFNIRFWYCSIEMKNQYVTKSVLTEREINKELILDLI